MMQMALMQQNAKIAVVSQTRELSSCPFCPRNQRKTIQLLEGRILWAEQSHLRRLLIANGLCPVTLLFT